MENTKKMTKRDFFNVLKEMVNADFTDNEVTTKADVLKFIDNELHLLDNRKGKSGKTKTQKINEELIETVFEVLQREGKPKTVTELLQNNADELVNPETKATMTGQKLSALLKKLVETDRVERTVDKKVAKFSVK